MELSSIPNEKRRIAKEIGTPGRSTIDINVEISNHSTTPNCGWSLKKYGNIQFISTFMDKFVDISDFENPVKTKLESYVILISSQLESNMKFSINKNQSLSDVGYIF